MSRRRVVITGAGVVSSIGIGVAEFEQGLRDGRNGASPITRFDTTGFPRRMGCEVQGFDLETPNSTLNGRRLGPAARFATAAGELAFEDAGVDPGSVDAVRFLVSVGTTDGESRDLDHLVEVELESGPESFNPDIAAAIPASRLSQAIVEKFELWDAESVTIATACSAGNYAIGYAYDAISSGDVDSALCGGADAMCRKTFAGFFRVGTIARDYCRPFDSDRSGILTGEGSAILYLETLESARSRGARIYAEVLGYGLNCDANHPVAPDGDSVADVMRLALADADIEPADVDFISAHGTGTQANDVTEAYAIRNVFPTPPPTISIKSLLGHTMGAASALAAVACAVGIHDGFIPPTINHRTTDPECGLDCVPNHARVAQPTVVLNNGMAFGGNNAAVVLAAVDRR